MTDHVAVLTYSISHEAMTHRSRGTAGALGSQCNLVHEMVTDTYGNVSDAWTDPSCNPDTCNEGDVAAS